MRKLILPLFIVLFFTLTVNAKQLILAEKMGSRGWSHSGKIKGISLRNDSGKMMIKIWAEKKYKGSKKVTLNPKTWKNINEIEIVPSPEWNYGYIIFNANQAQEAILLYRAISSSDTETVRLTTSELYFKSRDRKDGFDAFVQWGKKGSVRLY